MQTQNAKNTTDEYDLPSNIKTEVQNIIGKDLGKRETQNKIQEIINKHRQNSKLAVIFVKHLDAELLKGFSPEVQAQVAIDLIDSHKSAFDKLDEKTKSSSYFVENLIIAFIKAGKALINVEDFIKMNYSTKAQNEIFQANDIASIYNKIKGNMNASRDKQDIFFSKIKQNHSHFFKEILDKKIIEETQEGKINISEKFINLILSNYKQDSKFDLDLRLGAILGLGNFTQTQHYQNFKNFIYNELINHPQIKIELKLQQEKKKQTQDNNKGEKGKQEEEKKSVKQDNKKEESGLNEVDSSTEDSIGSGVSFGGGIVLYETNIQNKGEKIKMPIHITRGLNDKNITDFIEFYGLLKELKLNFLWDKYSRGFLTLLGNKNIDLTGAIRTGKYDNITLQMLNFLGKNIGIIGKVKTKTGNINENGDEESIVEEKNGFNTLSGAINIFRKIADSKKIGDTMYNQSDSYGPVEEYMIDNDLVDEQVPYLKMNNFQ